MNWGRSLAAAPKDRRAKRSEIALIEPRPSVAGEPVQWPPVHPLDEPAPTSTTTRGAGDGRRYDLGPLVVRLVPNAPGFVAVETSRRHSCGLTATG